MRLNRPGQPHIGNERSDRIDTTITLVRVRQGDVGPSPDIVAVAHVRSLFPEAEMLNVWSTHERHSSGDRVWAVEWADADNQT